MSGMLGIYLEQISRPSWWPVDDTPGRRPAQPVAAMKRRQVLDCVRAAEGPVSANWVMGYTGYTKQSVMHLLYALAEAGEVRRIEGGVRLLWGPA